MHDSPTDKGNSNARDKQGGKLRFFVHMVILIQYTMRYTELTPEQSQGLLAGLKRIAQ